MKAQSIAKDFLLFLCLMINLVSCASLSEQMLKNNPEFVNNAHQYHILHPIVHSSVKSFNFTIENDQIQKNIQTEVRWSKDTERESYIESFNNEPQNRSILDIFFAGHADESDPDIHDMKKGDMARIKEIIYHRVEISNPIGNNDYVILGGIEFYREKKQESENTTYETTQIIYPIEFRIFEEGKDVGKVEISRDKQLNSPFLHIDIFIHDKLFKIQFEEQFNKRKVSVELDNDLIAFFDLKPASFISTKMKGKAMIKPDLSQDLVADIFTSYILSTIARGSIKQM